VLGVATRVVPAVPVQRQGESAAFVTQSAGVRREILQ
jgi:hypothetical protein